MFAEVTIRVADRTASEAFYDTVLAELAIERSGRDGEGTRWGGFCVAPAGADRPPTQRLHIGFAAPSRAHVDAFWRAGIAAGHRDDGAPGPRPQYRPDYYGGFLLDPDGNSAEAVHHDAMPGRGPIDHLWIRVADVAAAARFYESIAPQAGLRRGSSPPEHAWFCGAGGSFTLVPGEPTAHVHIAFAASGGARLDRTLDPDGNTVEVVRADGT